MSRGTWLTGLMCAHHVTIAALARQMQVTQIRVRAVRAGDVWLTDLLRWEYRHGIAQVAIRRLLTGGVPKPLGSR